MAHPDPDHPTTLELLPGIDPAQALADIEGHYHNAVDHHIQLVEDDASPSEIFWANRAIDIWESATNDLRRLVAYQAPAATQPPGPTPPPPPPGNDRPGPTTSPPSSNTSWMRRLMPAWFRNDR